MEEAIPGAFARAEKREKRVSYLEGISCPADVQRLDLAELQTLAQEVRDFIIEVVSAKGGHFASSLGVVELTIALHKVFSPPADRILWDVGHQAYVHKILTGRRDRLWTIRQHGGISGFLRRAESEYDHFGAGHASTAISAAVGFATARDLSGQKHKVVAVVGDGAMTGGLAFEAMNNAGHSNRDLIVVLNDNAMSISPNVGAMSHYLTSLTTHPYYAKMKSEIYHLLGRVPAVGEPASELARRLEKGIKGALVPGALFQALGFHYYGPIDGHDLEELTSVLGNLKERHGAILLHVLTHKGKGYSYAEADPDGYHGMTPFEVQTGKKKPTTPAPPAYTAVFGEAMCEIAAKEPKLVAITAAMLGGTGLTKFQKLFPDRCYDVGIAEGHGVTFAGGLAAEGHRPVAAIYSTFLQRALDHTIHDVCLQNLPVVFACDRGGLAGADGPTHHGAFDLTYLRMIPNMVVCAPKDGNELRDLLWTGVRHLSSPFAVRYPRDSVPGHFDPSRTMREIPIGSWESLEEGEHGVLVATGTMVESALAVHRILRARGLEVGVVNGRFIKPIDERLLEELAGRYEALITIEENTLAGGFGSAVYEACQRQGLRLPVIRHLGLPDRFVEHGSREELLAEVGLLPDQIADRVAEILAEVPRTATHPKRRASEGWLD